MIRLATVDDIESIREIERRAGEQFRAIGMASVADDELPSEALLATFVAGRRLWVFDDSTGPVGYVAASIVDGRGHIVQVSVVPERRGERLGARLIDQVEEWARANDLHALTLTTFRDVPWNLPYYERIGFSELTPAPGTELAGVVAEEGEAFDPTTRVVMIRRLAGTGD